MPTLEPLAIPKLNIQMKKNIWLQLDSNQQPCSKLHLFGLCVVCCCWFAYGLTAKMGQLPS